MSRNQQTLLYLATYDWVLVIGTCWQILLPSTAADGLRILVFTLSLGACMGLALASIQNIVALRDAASSEIAKRHREMASGFGQARAVLSLLTLIYSFLRYYAGDLSKPLLLTCLLAPLLATLADFLVQRNLLASAQMEILPETNDQ